MYLQNVENVYDIEWVKGVKYREVFHANEVEMSEYALHESDPKMLFALFDAYEKECKRLIELELPLPAYDYALKCSHAFNLLDARGAISVTERADFIRRVRALAPGCAEGYLKMREGLGFPLLAAAQARAQAKARRRHQRAGSRERAQRTEVPMADLLFEIGSEEIPAGFVPRRCGAGGGPHEGARRGPPRPRRGEGGRHAAPARASGRVTSRRSSPTPPRRRSAPPCRRPSTRRASPPAAALGFAESQGVEVEALERAQTPKGEWLAARRW